MLYGTFAATQVLARLMISVRGGGGRDGVAGSECGRGHGGQGERPVRGRMGACAARPGMRQGAAPVDAAGAVAVARGVDFLEYRRLHAIPLTLPAENAAPVHRRARVVSFATVFRTRMLTVRMMYTAALWAPLPGPGSWSGAPTDVL